MSDFITGLETYEDVNEMLQHVKNHVPAPFIIFFDTTKLTEYCKTTKVLWYGVSQLSREKVNDKFKERDCVVLSVVTQKFRPCLEVNYWQNYEYKHLDYHE